MLLHTQRFNVATVKMQESPYNIYPCPEQVVLGMINSNITDNRILNSIFVYNFVLVIGIMNNIYYHILVRHNIIL